MALCDLVTWPPGETDTARLDEASIVGDQGVRMRQLDVHDDLPGLLRQYRLDAGFSQEALAERAQVGLRSIQGFERGERRPQRGTLQRLVRALGLSSQQSRHLEELAREPARPPRTPPLPPPTLLNPHVPAREDHSSLPVPLTSFVGREREVRDLARLLTTSRLLTLTGPPGVGKTRLALEVATTLAEDFADGVRLVSLAAIREPDLVLPALAQAARVEGYEGQPLVDRLIETLKARQILFVLDNFEQVVAAAPLVIKLLEGCPKLRVLATSRIRLRVRGEREFVVAPLGVPDLAAVGVDSNGLTSIAGDAVRLFVERACDAGVNLALDRENVSAIAQICRRLDGLPLAIELAAARCKVFAPPALLAHLDDRLSLLTTGPRDVPERQQTLRDAIAWSYDLLDPEEQVLSCHLAVFDGEFSLDAAAVVCGGRLDALASLVDKSLVETVAPQHREDDREPRFRMLETIREFAGEHLVARGEAETYRTKHAAYFLAIAEKGWPEFAPKTVQALDRFERANSNLRAALRYLIDRGDVERASRLSALWVFWCVRGYVDEARAWLAELLSLTAEGDRTAARANLLFWDGQLAFKESRNALACRRLEESVSIFRVLGDRRNVADGLGFLGLIARWQGDYDRARRLFEERVAICQELGDQVEVMGTSCDWLAMTSFRQSGDAAGARALVEQAVAMWRTLGARAAEGGVLHNLGCVAHAMGDYPAAQTCFEQSLAIAREFGFRVGIGEALAGLGDLALDRGDLDATRRHLAEALPIQRDLGNRREIARLLEGFAGLAALGDQPERAIRLWAAAAALREIIEEPIPPDQEVRLVRRLKPVRAVVGEAVFARVWAQGQAMSLDQAVAYALEKDDRGRDETGLGS